MLELCTMNQPGTSCSLVKLSTSSIFHKQASSPRMSNLNLLHKTLGSHFVSPSTRAKHDIPVFFRQSPRFFSEGEQPPSQPAADPFLDRSKSTGLVYGKLYGITRNTLKTDIVNFLEGCNLSLNDVKVEYNRSFIPTFMMVQFSSQQAYVNAIQVVVRKGRAYKLERAADHRQWELLSPYNGKTVLLQGIPRNALVEDVERFLSGCDYDATSINMFFKASVPDPIRMATVLFPSPTQAMHAFLTKNRGFCLNNQILMRVLQ